MFDNNPAVSFGRLVAPGDERKAALSISALATPDQLVAQLGSPRIAKAASLY
jgi:hypothetical protein